MAGTFMYMLLQLTNLWNQFENITRLLYQAFKGYNYTFLFQLESVDWLQTKPSAISR